MVKIEGLNPLLAKLARLENLIGELAEPTREVLELLKGRMQDYPPPPPGSRYIRTYRLRNSWQENVILAGSVLGAVQSFDVPYAHLVQDREMQADIHRGRWQTKQSVAADSEEDVIRVYEAYLQELIDRL